MLNSIVPFGLIEVWLTFPFSMLHEEIIMAWTEQYWEIRQQAISVIHFEVF